MGIQPDLEELDSECRGGGGHAKAGHDDVFAQGPASIVLPAVERFARRLWDRFQLQLQWAKSEIFSWDGKLPEGAPDGVRVAGKVIDDKFEVGFDCYGVPMGASPYRPYIQSELMVRAEEIMEDGRKAVHLFRSNRQALWSALRLSISQRFQYVWQLTPPSLWLPG